MNLPKRSDSERRRGSTKNVTQFALWQEFAMTYLIKQNEVINSAITVRSKIMSHAIASEKQCIKTKIETIKKLSMEEERRNEINR